MPAASCQSLVNAYVDWLRSRITVSRIKDVCEITTPFLDRHNDYLQIYVKPTRDGLLLTDDGYILRDLSLSGCDLSSPRRHQTLMATLNGLGVRLAGEELVTEATPESFPQRKHRLLQAMLAIGDMFLTAQPHVASLFIEDVGRFLRTHDVRFVEHVQLAGRSGFSHSFDFVIPASSSKPERIIRAINRPNRDSITSFLFAWNDTKENRSPESAGYAVLNDADKAPSAEIHDALRQYGAIGIPWSRRDEFVPHLAA
jgi:hypothetical protein